MAKKPQARFAFRIVEGPAAGLACGGWRVWTYKEDTYVTAKSLGDTWKVSLHADAWWASSVTKENSVRPDTVLPPGHDRAMWKFEPTEFHDGRRIAFAIGVFRHALLPEVKDNMELTVPVLDRWDILTLAAIRMTESGVGPDAAWDVLSGPLSLESGRRVWITKSYEQLPDAEPEPIAIGTMIEPVSPEKNGVAAPGWLVKGVHLG